MRILLESSGSLVSSFMIKAVKDAGHVAIASDISEFVVGRYLSDEFVVMPKYSDHNFIERICDILHEKKVDIVIPSFDETLIEWSNLNFHQNSNQIKTKSKILISNPEVLNIFLDKWETYKFFVENNIPTPKTSLKQIYELVKPRQGRGGKGVKITNKKLDMTNNISQELLKGDEYTVDVLCGLDHKPIYIIPRKRLNVISGKSTNGIVVKNLEINKYVFDICQKTKFIGPINFQCFVDNRYKIKFVEVNPRISGGMALAFASSENWIPIMVSMLSGFNNFLPKKITYGMRMLRSFDEIYIPPN